MTRPLSMIVMAIVASSLQSCGGADTYAPYVWPITPYGEPSPQSFQVRYSDWWNSPEEVRTVITSECGEKFIVARVTELPYQGTLIHPQVLKVECGVSSLPSDRVNRRSETTYLVRLRE